VPQWHLGSTPFAADRFRLREPVIVIGSLGLALVVDFSPVDGRTFASS
jgi:hypothetical protein